MSLFDDGRCLEFGHEWREMTLSELDEWREMARAMDVSMKFGFRGLEGMRAPAGARCLPSATP